MAEVHERPVRTLKIAMMGSRGVPARYGGFETAVEEIGRRLVAMGHDVLVFCRTGDKTRSSFQGIRLVHLPAVKSKFFETLSHTAFSSLHPSLAGSDVAFIFNAANAPILPVLKLRGIPAVVHVDGLEWKRTKWSGLGKRYYLTAEKIAVKYADALISDARGIQDYYREVHGVESEFIPYGAEVLRARELHGLHALGLQPFGYHLVVARFEPENNLEVMLTGYCSSSASAPLLVVGSAPYAGEYVDRLHRIAHGDARIKMVGAIWDQEVLNDLYAGALTYFHGHSVGGTNPSLLRAMGAGAPVAAFDVCFNREVLGGTGLFWRGPEDVRACAERAERNKVEAARRGKEGQLRIQSDYNWDDVATRYAELAERLACIRQ